LARQLHDACEHSTQPSVFEYARIIAMALMVAGPAIKPSRQTLRFSAQCDSEILRALDFLAQQRSQSPQRGPEAAAVSIHRGLRFALSGYRPR